MEFCQIQLNYMDWTLQDAKEKCRLLNEYHIPIWVMEPVRGGKLAALSEADMKKLQALRRTTARRSGPSAGCRAWKGCALC